MMISISSDFLYETQNSAIVNEDQSALVIVSARVQLCYTKSYVTPLQPTLFDIPGIR